MTGNHTAHPSTSQWCLYYDGSFEIDRMRNNNSIKCKIKHTHNLSFQNIAQFFIHQFWPHTCVCVCDYERLKWREKIKQHAVNMMQWNWRFFIAFFLFSPFIEWVTTKKYYLFCNIPQQNAIISSNVSAFLVLQFCYSNITMKVVFPQHFKQPMHF